MNLITNQVSQTHKSSLSEVALVCPKTTLLVDQTSKNPQNWYNKSSESSNSSKVKECNCLIINRGVQPLTCNDFVAKEWKI